MRLDTTAMGLLEMVDLADCRRRRVTALVCLEDGTVVGRGWNGLRGGASCLAGECPRGLLSYDQQPPDVGYTETGCTALHAEDMALAEAGLLADGAIVLITEKPCPGCAELLREANVSVAFVVTFDGGEIVDVVAFLDG